MGSVVWLLFVIERIVSFTASSLEYLYHQETAFSETIQLR